MSNVQAGALGGAISLLLLLALLALRDGRRWASARYCALFAVGSAATLIVFIPELSADPAFWLAPIRVLAFGNAAFFWLAALSLFDDEFKLSWWMAPAWSVLVALGFWAIYGARAHPFLLFNALSFICVAAALWGVFAGRRDDLVEPRRRFRFVFIGVSGGFVALITAMTVALHGGTNYPALGLFNAFGALAISFLFAQILFTLNPRVLFEPVGDVESPARSKPAADVDRDDPRDEAVLVGLRRHMEDDRAYRDGALSITKLAAHLGIPEYRLRRLINGRLGHTNFHAFVNKYRLDEALVALADPGQEQVPILTIALDAGFQSIGPFNRAFKARTGLTPSEFRARGLESKAD